MSITPEKVTEWVRSIMCMLMSVTRVNLVEAESLEVAEIPISFLKEADYINLNQPENSIAFCDIHQMKVSQRVPIHVNTNPKNATWLSLSEDRLVFGKREFNIFSQSFMH